SYRDGKACQRRLVTNISVRFWGVRGSTPCPGPGTARYGGNTSCVEVRCGDRLLIFDAGTGLRLLGNSLDQEAVDATFFLSLCHTHHLAGLPFFAPAYRPPTRLRGWAGHLLPDCSLSLVARTVMSEPLFPGAGGIFKAGITFRDFRAGQVLQP